MEFVLFPSKCCQSGSYYPMNKCRKKKTWIPNHLSLPLSSILWFRCQCYLQSDWGEAVCGVTGSLGHSPHFSKWAWLICRVGGCGARGEGDIDRIICMSAKLQAGEWLNGSYKGIDGMWWLLQPKLPPRCTRPPPPAWSVRGAVQNDRSLAAAGLTVSDDSDVLSQPRQNNFPFNSLNAEEKNKCNFHVKTMNVTFCCQIYFSFLVLVSKNNKGSVS